MSFLDVQTFACIKITSSEIYMFIIFSPVTVPNKEVMNFRRRVLGRERRDNSQLANKQGVMYISLGKLILKVLKNEKKRRGLKVVAFDR
jgi:hypothetical protein